MPGTHPGTHSSTFYFFPQGSLTSRDYALSKCYLPFEDRVLTTYGAAVSFLVLLILAHFERLPSSLLSAWKLCRVHTRRWWRRWLLHLVIAINTKGIGPLVGLMWATEVSKYLLSLCTSWEFQIIHASGCRINSCLSCSHAIKNGTCTPQVCLFVLSNICIIKGCICTVYKCYGHCHLHAPHTALASPERTQQSWCTLEATCVPQSWIFSVPLCSGSRFLIDHEVLCSKAQIQCAGTCLLQALDSVLMGSGF